MLGGSRGREATRGLAAGTARQPEMAGPVNGEGRPVRAVPSEAESLIRPKCEHPCPACWPGGCSHRFLCSDEQRSEPSEPSLADLRALFPAPAPTSPLPPRPPDPPRCSIANTAAIGRAVRARSAPREEPSVAPSRCPAPIEGGSRRAGRARGARRVYLSASCRSWIVDCIESTSSASSGRNSSTFSVVLAPIGVGLIRPSCSRTRSE